VFPFFFMGSTEADNPADFVPLGINDNVWFAVRIAHETLHADFSIICTAINFQQGVWPIQINNILKRQSPFADIPVILIRVEFNLH